MLVLLLLLSGIWILPYVVGPLQLRRQFQHRREADTRAYALGDVPPLVQHAWESLPDDIVVRGYTPMGAVRVITSPHFEAWHAVFRQEASPTEALLTVVVHVGRGTGNVERRVDARFLSLHTRFEDERELVTTNARADAPLGGPRQQRVLRALTDLPFSELEALHQARVEGIEGTEPSALLGSSIEEIAEQFRLDAARWADTQVRRGNLTALEGTRESDLRLTWRGACRAVWAQLWPRRLFTERAHRAALARLDTPGAPAATGEPTTPAPARDAKRETEDAAR